jgi:hypothetical protein
MEIEFSFPNKLYDLNGNRNSRILHRIGGKSSIDSAGDVLDINFNGNKKEERKNFLC